MLIAAAAVLVLWPATIAPQAWTPSPIASSPIPVTPIQSERLAQSLEGPAFLAAGPEGHLLTGLADGRIALFEVDEDDAGEDHDAGGPSSEPEQRNADAGALEVAGVAPGRPFGVARGLGEAVIAAAGDKGLIAAIEGRILPLAADAQGRPILHAADVAVSFARGTIYFTDASDRHTPAQSWAEFVEHGAHGRLLAYDSNRRQTTQLTDGLHFPFGIALAPDESYLLVCEMTEYRVARHWFAGDRKGTTETFAGGLPGYPADIAADGHGGWWLSLYAPRIASLDRLAGAPWLRRLWFKLPRSLQPMPDRRTWVLALDGAGRITQDLRLDGPDAYAPVIGVLEREGRLYLGSPTQKGILEVGLAEH